VKSALDVHRALLADAVPHEILRLRSPVLTADDLPRALGVPRTSCAAVRCYRTTEDGGSAMVAVLVRAGDVPDPSSLLTALDVSSVRPATAAEVNEATDYAAGLVSPLCLPDDVLLLADAALGGSDVLYVPTGETGVALGIGVRDLLVASGAKVTTLTAGRLDVAERSGWQSGPGLATEDAHVLSLRRRPRVAARRTG
jgi:prolyl-tRNA editing enzyme YbaK/EbsC (Cys-tRNA(Pro) deacylase)